MATQTLGKLRSRLRELPTTVAGAVAEKTAPEFTTMALNAYDSTKDVYGAARRVSEVDGHALTLRRSGDAERGIKFEALGTLVRVKLEQPYIKYLIGKYRILPNGPLPGTWVKTIDRIVQQTKAPA